MKTISSNLITQIKQNSKRLFFYFLIILIALFLLWNSGYLGQQLVSSRVRQILLILSVFFMFFMFVLLIDYSKIIESLKKKRYGVLFSKEFFIFGGLFVFVLISFVFNTNRTENLNSFLMLFATLLCSFLVIRLFSFPHFAKLFVTINLVVSLIALVFHLFYMISGRDLSLTILQKNDNIYVTSFFGFFFRIQTNYNDRIQGPFWEPGVFATFCLLSTLLYHYFINKKITMITVFFSAMVILTKSTAGYIILIPVWLLIIMNQLNAKRKQWLFLIMIGTGLLSVLFYPTIINFLAEKLPDIFGKIADQNVSFITRISSVYYGFRIFLTSPFFGVGGVTARNLYFDLVMIDNMSIDAFTSTLGYYIASYGVVGLLIFILPIIGIIVTPKIDFENKIVMVILYLLISQKESHVELMLVQIVYFFIFIHSLASRKWIDTKPLLVEIDNKNNLLNLLFRKDESGNLASNLTINTFVKILSLIVGFITIPVYYKYFGANQLFYGLWLTIISTSTWILTFDFGFGNSLRNRLSAAIANNKAGDSQKLISTTYLLTCAMSILLLSITTALIFIVDLNSFFKVSPDLVSLQTLRSTVFIILLTISLELVLKNIIFILQVIGKSGFASSLSLISNIALLIVLSVFSIPNESKYIFISLIYFAALLLPLIVATVYVFIYKKTVPKISFKSVDKRSFSLIAKMGIGFFVVQLSNLFLWALNDILITNLLGTPALVVDYTIFYKLYSSILGLSMIIQGPIWVNVSMSLARGDKKSISNSIKFAFLFESLLFILTVVVTLGLPFILELWLGEQVPSILFSDVIIMLAYSFISAFYGAIVLICNGLGELKSQIIIAGSSVILKIPLVLLLSLIFKDKLSWSIVILANSILLIPYLIVCPIRVKKIVSKLELLNG